MSSAPSNPLLIVISGPSGSGKTTLCRRLVREVPSVFYSVSCTTRPARPDEAPGESYHFMDEAAYRAKVEADAFLEHAVVHGYGYGTLRETVFEALNRGRDVLMDIDIQGAAQLRARVQSAPPGDRLREALVDVFVAPPSMEALHRRLRARGMDDAGVIARRMKTATGEMAQRREYAYLIVNDKLEESSGVLRAIVTAEHHRVHRRKDLHVC